MARYGVRGVAGLKAAMEALARAPTPRKRRSARQEAGEVIAQEYRQNLEANGSRETGALVASIGVAEDQEKEGRTLVGARAGRFKKQRPASYSHFPEFGTAPHFQPNRFGGIQHPGARPKPALRPALDRNIARAAQAYFDDMKRTIEEAAGRLSSRSRRR